MYLKYIFKLFITFFSLSQLAAQCIDTNLIDPNGVCAAIYDPVCGCNNKTYDNNCNAEIIDGITSTTPGICAVAQTDTICLGSMFPIGVTNNTTSTYVWSPSNNLSCSNCAITIASPTSSTLYELKTTDSAGAISYTYFDILIENCPTRIDTICSGAAVDIGVATDPLYTYIWKPSNNLSCIDCSNPTASPTSSTLYELITTDASQNSTLTYFEIFVDNCPTQVTQTDTICLGSMLPIGITNNAASTYAWNPTNNISCTDCSIAIATPTISTLYELKITDVAGVESFNYFDIFVETCPIVPERIDTICLGANVQIGIATDPLNTYSWNPNNNLSCTDCSNPTANPGTSTLYELTATDATGAESISYFDIFVETCPIVPERIDTICSGANVQIGITADPLNTYSWNPNNNLSCTDCSNPTASPSTSTLYELTTTDASQNSTKTYFEIVVKQCSFCENNDGFSYQINDIVKTGNDPAAQIDLLIDFTRVFQPDNACIWNWDFGNGNTSTDRNPSGISFALVEDSLAVNLPYNVCMSIFNCNNQLIETCCQEIGPFTECQDNSLINSVQNCDTTVEPICGCNDKSYQNICSAINNDGVYNWTDGPCSIDNTYQICVGDAVRIGSNIFTSGVRYSWFPTTSLSCSNSCFQTTASPQENTLYQLTTSKIATGETTYQYYQVNVLPKDFCCSSANLDWLDNLLEDDFCSDCYTEVEKIDIEGIDYYYFKKDTISSCSAKKSYLTYCNGAVFCSEDTTGFCLDSLNYTVTENVWNKGSFCDLCNVNDANSIDWLYNTYGNGNYEVNRYSFNNSITLFIEKCSTTAADTINKMLVNCNNELLCSWDGYTLVSGENCNNFYTQGTFIEQIFSCGCIDESLINPNRNCSSFNAPVCGCDGKTYSNFCIGQRTGGITSWTTGSCRNNGNCVDTLQILSGFLDSQQLKAKQAIQVGVPIIGNNVVLMEAEQSIELLNGFECPKNATIEIDHKVCY